MPLNFPDPNVTKQYEEAGLLWEWNSDLEVWSAATVYGTTPVVLKAGMTIEVPREVDATPLKLYGNSASGNNALFIGHMSSGGVPTDYLRINKLGQLKTIAYDPADQNSHGYLLRVTADDGTDQPTFGIQNPVGAPATNHLISVYHGSTEVFSVDGEGNVAITGNLQLKDSTGQAWNIGVSTTGTLEITQATS